MVRLRKKELDEKELLASLNRIDSPHQTDNDGFHGFAAESKLDSGKLFLDEIIHSPVVVIRQTKNIRALDPKPLVTDATYLTKEVVTECRCSNNPSAKELANLLEKSHIKALVGVHDEVARQPEKKEGPQKNLLFSEELLNSDMPTETIKMIGLRKKPKEPLGLTVELDEHQQLIVARILAGGVIDKQCLLNTGDIILEVNGVPVKTPEELQLEVSKSKENLTLKIEPNFQEEVTSARLTVANSMTNGKNLEPGKKLTCYMRALFDYDPSTDTILPCKEIGLQFKRGDILQIISVKDPNWWQAKLVNDPSGKVGLVPSQELEERRKAFVPPEADYVHKIGICGTRVSKRKRKTMYKWVANCEFDKADLMLYEEVTRMPPFKRKTLILIGVQGVGRRTLKTRLINSDPDKFGTIIPHTSRPPRALEEDGKNYWFMDRMDMEDEIQSNKFLEYGEYNGNLYGTHLNSIYDVIKSGKMCVLDSAPSALKILHNSPELMPFVIFIAAPGMETLKQIYAERKATGGSSRNLTFDRQSSIRYSSRRARTLESLASLYEDDDLVATLEESSILQRKYEKFFDMVIVNEDFDETFRKVVKTLDQLSHEHQWVPVNWIY